jgi:hypothetical protein
MRILFISEGDTQVYNSTQEFRDALDNEDISMNRGWGPRPAAYELPETLPEVEVEEIEITTKYVVKTSESSTDIPAPREGETVTAYAKRLAALA